MSFTARERNNPPPRKKSCAACIKAKRRCDFAVPACLRCSQRRIECEYPSRTPQVKAKVKAPKRVSHEPTPLQDVVVADGAVGDGCTGGHAAPVDGEASQYGMHPFLCDLETLDYGAESQGYDVVHQPSMLAAPTTKGLHDRLTEVVARRLQFSLDQIQKAPRTMVMETRTPWSHPLVYADGMPRSMQDAHASCALYLAKNRANAPVILRCIESRVEDLLCEPLPTTPMDSLAHTQALLLYQIIRLFDGDISARASGERLIPILETSAIGLLAHVVFDTEANCPDRFAECCVATLSDLWKDWIFQESARRTLLFTFFFLQAYRLLTGSQNLYQCDGRLGLCHSWMVSEHLWQAETALEFRDAWRQKNHFLVIDGQFTAVLSEAKAADVDLFGKMLLSAAMGIPELEAWFASRGGSLK
ncbi:uncharacterized protein TrAFT101_009614 [Trichoderma asperellum]|uniref:Zn(2)-C6 fungal-type domain-containing protein n=1 Tax=Trichoderma asperellum (strain ATCC 204424 / CBS 433.97 / NBRC 101777) TaxID=1042311 RepID=A0A2T3ZAD2_TRIA4|nr:hypothetical protein M441DRAFT_46890 [Trichoderma asperellum CBS 433.97]PTB41771.1 hypothetical protein M441DRAFT_46890 [Trichoderma asperellum CBS 433.97]UKZ94761.1 hypothetical protein TrAFT101_009614 [Trichoderma asperellum]